MRFAEPYKSLPPQVHPEAEGDRTDAIAAFLNEAKRRLHPLGASSRADVFGLSPNDPRDVNIGQQWETISATADHILPMMYPSHYLPTHLPGVPQPGPDAVRGALQVGGDGARAQRAAARGGRAPGAGDPLAPGLHRHLARATTRSTARSSSATQKRGVYDVGLDDWVLWHPGSQVRAHPGRAWRRRPASRPKSGYTPPADVVAMLRLLEAQGAREAREKAVQQAHGDTRDPEAAEAAKTGQGG